MSEMSCTCLASNHRKKKNKSLGSAEADVMTKPELHELRRLVQSQAAQIKILQDQLYQYPTSPEQQEEPELLELVTAEHHRTFMTFCGVDSKIDLQGSMELQAYLKHISPKWSLQWWKERGDRKEIGAVPQQVTRKGPLWHCFASTVRV